MLDLSGNGCVSHISTTSFTGHSYRGKNKGVTANAAQEQGGLRLGAAPELEHRGGQPLLCTQSGRNHAVWEAHPCQSLTYSHRLRYSALELLHHHLS